MAQLQWTVFCFILYNIGLITGQLTPSDTYTDIIREIYVDPSDVDCSSSSTSSMCSQLNSTCSNLGLCGRNCVGRLDYPTLHVLSSESDHFKDCLVSNSAISSPPNADNELLQFQSNKKCLQEIQFNYDSTVSFWILGTCGNKCQILSINGNNGKKYNLFLENNRIVLNNVPITSAVTTAWLNIILRIKKEKEIELFINNVQKVITPNVLLSTDNTTTIDFGPQAGLSNADNFTVVDVRIYEDFLTNREIQSIYNGGTVVQNDCRCPSSHPRASADNCVGSQNTISKYRDGYYSIDSAVLDGNTSTKWSTDSKLFSIFINLYDTYHLDKINITLEASRPITIEIKLLNNGQWNSMDSSICNIQDDIIMCSFSSDNPTNHSASSIEIKFNGLQSTGGSTDMRLLIPEITATGRCSCNFNADSCIRPNNYQTYTCQCKSATKSAGAKCEGCVANSVRLSNQFACTSTCMCEPDRVQDVNDMCYADGRCKCKEGRVGDKCENCGDLYYNMSGECAPCSCKQSISKNCSKTDGSCDCKDNVEAGNSSKCDVCSKGYYNIEEGCQPCQCNTNGTINNSIECDPITGQCQCKPNVDGKKCHSCQDGFYGLTDNSGCKACNCNLQGSTSNICFKVTGQCPCYDTDNTDLQCIPRGNMTITYGPKSGGTEVTISGRHFVNDPEILINDKRQTLQFRNLTYIIFTTTSNEIGVYDTKLKWQNYTLNVETFTFKTDPVVKEPMNKNLASLKGCELTFEGSHFDSVFSPTLIVTTNDQNFTMKCMMENETKIVCIIADYLPTNKLLSTYLNLDCPNCSPTNTLTIADDPQVTSSLDEDFTYPFTKTITISGKQFDVCQKENIEVYIGSTKCEITSLTNTQIICKPPEDQLNENQYTYQIWVNIGKMKFLAGTITYRSVVNSNYFIYIMVGIFGTLFLILAILATCCFWRKRRDKKSLNSEIGISLDIHHSTLQTNPYTNSTFGKNSDTSLNKVTEYTVEDIKPDFLKNIQHGLKSEVEKSLILIDKFTLGNVCTAKGDKARIIDGISIPDNSKLTIKSLRSPLTDGSYPDWVPTMLTECLRFRSVNDDNILTICGIGLEKHKFHIIYPYMKNRTLKDFICDTNKEFSLKELLEYGAQVAEGMSHLSDLNIVHRDLAARNCMVDHAKTIKICDAAFSCDFYPTEYMNDSQKNRFLPIRWMAPECIACGFYDTKSDVWSYGILLWELLTRGCLPFIDTPDDGIYDLIIEGYRLGRPDIVSDKIYELLNKCWEEESEFRPTFQQLIDSLTAVMTGDSERQIDYINLNKPQESIYMNSESIKRKTAKISNDQHIYGNI